MDQKTRPCDDVPTHMRQQIAKNRKRKLDRERQAKIRRLAGRMPRKQYEALSLSATKPWMKLGMSRAKWYRLGKPVPETGLVTESA